MPFRSGPGRLPCRRSTAESGKSHRQADRNQAAGTKPGQQASSVFHAAGQEQLRVRRTTMSGLLSLFPQIAAHDPVPGSGTMRAVRAYLPHGGRIPRWRDLAADSARTLTFPCVNGHVVINETAWEMAGVDGCLQSSSMSDAECAERIRLQYLRPASAARRSAGRAFAPDCRRCRRALRTAKPVTTSGTSAPPCTFRPVGRCPITAKTPATCHPHPADAWEGTQLSHPTAAPRSGE